MKILDVVFIKGRGDVAICRLECSLTMDDVRSDCLRLVRTSDRSTWTIIGVERHCVPPQADQPVGLLLREFRRDLRKGDNVEIDKIEQKRSG